MSDKKRAAFRELRNLANMDRAIKNQELRERGEPTPWESAQAERKRRRVGKPRKKIESLEITLNDRVFDRDGGTPGSRKGRK